MSIKQLLVTLVLTALGFFAGTVPYIGVLAALFALGYNFHAMGPAPLICLTVAAGTAVAVYLYARNHRAQSTRMLLPFMGGILLFFIVAGAVTSSTAGVS